MFFHKNQVVPIANGGTGANDANSGLVNLFSGLKWIRDSSTEAPNVIFEEGVTFAGGSSDRFYNELLLYFPNSFAFNINMTNQTNGFKTIASILLQGNHKKKH